MVWSGPPVSDAPPIVLSWAEHRAAGHVALALLSMTDATYGGRRGLVALDAGGGRYVQARGGDDVIELAAADGSFAEPPFRLNRAQRQAMRRLRWDAPGPAPSHYTMAVQPPLLDMRSLAALLLDTLVRGLGVEPDAPVRLQLWRHKADERGRTLLADTVPPPSIDLGRWRPDMYGSQTEGLLDADLSGLLPFVLITHDGPTPNFAERHKPGLYRLVRYLEGEPHEEYGEGFLLPVATAAPAVRAVLEPICAEIDSLTDETTVARRRRAARLLGRARVEGAALGFRVLEAAPARGFVELAPSPALFRRLRASFAMASGLGTTTRYPIRLKAHAPFPFRRVADAMEWVWHDRSGPWHPFRAYLVTGPLSHLATFRRVRAPGTQQATPELDLVRWFKPRGRVANLDVRLVQEGYGVVRCLLGTRRQRMAIDLHAHTTALAELVLWLKRLDAGDLPASVALPGPERGFLLRAYAADRLGLAFLIGTTDGAPALQAVVRPRELARAARLAFMALVEDRVDHTLWPTPDPAYPPHVILPDPWFDDAVCPERAALMDELIERVETVNDWGVFRGSTTRRLREIVTHVRGYRPV